jgi:hypothetical protein
MTHSPRPAKVRTTCWFRISRIDGRTWTPSRSHMDGNRSASATQKRVSRCCCARERKACASASCSGWVSGAVRKRQNTPTTRSEDRQASRSAFSSSSSCSLPCPSAHHRERAAAARFSASRRRSRSASSSGSVSVVVAEAPKEAPRSCSRSSPSRIASTRSATASTTRCTALWEPVAGSFRANPCVPPSAATLDDCDVGMAPVSTAPWPLLRCFPRPSADQCQTGTL